MLGCLIFLMRIEIRYLQRSSGTTTPLGPWIAQETEYIVGKIFHTIQLQCIVSKAR